MVLKKYLFLYRARFCSVTRLSTASFKKEGLISKLLKSLTSLASFDSKVNTAKDGKTKTKKVNNKNLKGIPEQQTINTKFVCIIIWINILSKGACISN